MEKKKVLFICIHNSARSQMAEAILNRLAPDKFEVESAGLEAGKLNPLAVEAMRDYGVDISGNKTKNAFDFLKQGKIYHYVIAVCDGASAGRCPIFPGALERLHWEFDDPSALKGSHEEKIKKTIAIRNQIEEKIKEFIKMYSQ
jgi:arsenate reductase (thioredoxin)